MGLILTIEEGGQGAATLYEMRVDRAPFTIGRAPDNDWVLPDPGRFLSKKHCLIEQQGSSWSITDTSSNGVFLGSSNEPIGRGRSAILDDNTVIRVGDYSIRASVDDAQAPTMSKGLLDDPLDPFSAPPPPKRETNDSLLDQSWVQNHSMRAPDHPSLRPQEGPATPSDHISPEHQSLDLSSPGRKSVSLFDDAQDNLTEPPFAAPQSPTPKVDPFDTTEENRFRRPRPEPQRPPPPTPEPPRARSRPNQSIDGDALVAAFLEGAGVDPRQVPVEDAEAFLRENGALFRELVFGLSQLLANRAMLKREIGVDQTMIGAAGNNPLKMSASPEEAVLSLLTFRGTGYLDPLPSVLSAFDDIKSHEVAMLDATQEALNTLLRRFKPEALEHELANTSALSHLFSGGRKAKTWEMFKERYNEIAKSAHERFLGEAGVGYAQAYKQTTRNK